jgi:heme oxygenase
MNPSGPAVTGALRQACAAQHAAIEALLKLDQPLQYDRYARVLAGFAAFLPCWEARLRPCLPARLQGWFEQRSRLPMLRRDLAALGLQPFAMEDPVAALALPDMGAVFGSLYVLEGSALGGQMIARQLHLHLGLGPDNGAAYFNGWGERTGALWADFRERLALELGPDEAALRSACAAAVATFEALRACFVQVLGPGPAAA